MDMGIVNAGQLALYDDIPAELRELAEDVILNRRPDATDRLLDAAPNFKGDGSGQKAKEKDLTWREGTVERVSRIRSCTASRTGSRPTPRKRARNFRSRCTSSKARSWTA